MANEDTNLPDTPAGSLQLNGEDISMSMSQEGKEDEEAKFEDFINHGMYKKYA